MICSICGCEMKNNGDWFACPTCGSVHFGPDPDENKSTAEPEIKEAPISKIKEESVKKDELLFDFEKEFFKTETPSYKTEERPVVTERTPAPQEEKAVIKEAPTAEIAEPIAKKAEPIAEGTQPIEKKAEPVVEETQPITKEAEPVVEETQPITKEAEPTDNNTPLPDEKQDDSEEDGIDLTAVFNETPVKPDAFILDKDAFNDNLTSFFDSIEDGTEAETRRRRKKDKSDETDGKEKKHPLKDIVDFMLPIVAAIVIAFVLKTFIIANAKVPTSSMVATINVGDRIIASRLAYRTETPQRYDIVLFYYPDDENDIFVKRVLGLPGETLEVIDGVVYITTAKGKTIQTDQSFVNPAETPTGNSGPYYIPEKGETITFDGAYCYAENGMLLGYSSFIDKYCVMDNHGNYVIAENLYFMMGDNRNYSSDSRKWDFPYVAENKIIGKVLYRYYPFENMGKIE